jgi:hypothetical protein
MIVVNFSTNQYKIGQDRLRASLNGHKNLMLTDHLAGCPHHRESPYEFKIHAIERAWQQSDVVLWCDASMYLVGDLSKIENIIKQDGYFMEEAGHYVKDWCNVRARNYFKLTPEESHFTMFSAGLLGLDKRSPIAMDWFKQWKASAKAGCFKGQWQDHRHDMTCGSIIAQRLGMKYQKGHTHMSYIGESFGPPNPESVFHLKGIV